jgi:type VI secretion system lysozyme-like protein
MPTPQTLLAPSFLDRLLDAATGDVESGARGAKVSALDESAMIAVIGRDLEDLLNSRATHQGLVAADSELANTILTYGLTDIGSLELCGGKQRERMADAVTQAIRLHEPRLRDVRVLIPDPFSAKERTLRLLVEGRLQVEPATWVAFEARLARGTGQYTVQST